MGGVGEVGGGGDPAFPTLEDFVGRTPLVRLQRLGPAEGGSAVLCKLEGNNPAGSVKDRPALHMIARAEAAGRISPGDTLIEATSGNTGIALAMAAAIRGYRMVLIMPENMSEERRASMAAFGAELVLVPRGSMETARDLAKAMEAAGEGTVLDQFGNGDNPEAHFAATGPELWEQTGGRITHFVSSMGTTGTIMGVSRYLKGRNPDVQIVGLQPAEGAAIPGIRRWPPEYLPSIYEDARVDLKLDISQKEAEDTTRALAREEGIFCGVSSGGAVAGALRVAAGTRDAVIACIVCDRGDRYLSTGVFDAPAELPFWGGERRGSLLGGDGAAGQSGGRVADCNALGFRTALPAVLNEHRRALVFFSGGPAREPSWCPDCRRVAPLVEEAAAAAGALLLHVDVGDRAAWKDPEHPLRTAPDVQLACVPTLMWARRDGGLGPALGPEIEKCESAAELRAALLQFAQPE